MNFGRYLNKGVEKETFSTELTSTTSTILPPLNDRLPLLELQIILPSSFFG
jgi:hypothetical protein